MGDKRNILVSGIGKRNVLLSLIGEECHRFGANLIGVDASPNPPARLAVSNFQMVPNVVDPQFSNKFMRVLLDHNVSGYLTLIDPEIPILGLIEMHTPDLHARFLHPTPATSELCEDKFAFAQYMQKAGVAVFPTFLERPEIYPHIRKDRRGSAASGFQMIASPEQAAETNNANSGQYIYQRFCGGAHYCVDAYYALNGGELVDFCAKEVVVKSKGESFLLRSCPRGEFEALLREIGRKIDLRGIVNFDFLDDNGTLRLLEINCRIGGNYPASHGFGCNLLALCFEELFAHNQEKAKFSDYAVDQYIAKYFAFSPPVPLEAMPSK